MVVIGSILLSSCDSYLDIQPVGQVIPTTLTEYRALLTTAYGLKLIDKSVTEFRTDIAMVTDNSNSQNFYSEIEKWNDMSPKDGTREFGWAVYYSVIYYANKVVESGKFALENNFSNLFDINNRKSQEFIFSIQFSEDEVFNGDGNQMHMYYVSVYENFPGMGRDIVNGRSWKRVMPTNFVFEELFDHKNDARLYKSFQWTYMANKASTIPTWKTIEDKDGNVIFQPAPGLEGTPKFALGDTAACFTPETLPLSGNDLTAYCAAKPYSFVPVNNYTDLLYPSLVKWLDPNRPDMQYQPGSRNWVKMRFAETYLILAEAYGRKGDFAKAAEYINIVRARAAYKENEFRPVWAGGSFTSTKDGMMVTAGEISNNFVDFMLDELGREFLGEARRWEDLVRCEKLVERVKAHNVLAAPNIRDYHKLRPIPQKHIDRLDPVGPMSEEQNEGYY